MTINEVGLPQGLVDKESTCNAGDTGDTDSILGSGRSPGEANSNHSNILAWKIPWTKEPRGLQSKGSQRVGHNWATKHAHKWTRTFQSCKSLYCTPVTYIILYSNNISISKNNSKKKTYCFIATIVLKSKVQSSECNLSPWLVSPLGMWHFPITGNHHTFFTISFFSHIGFIGFFL